MKGFNWPIFWIGNAWLLIETAHFGWNSLPKSDAEVICDGIGCLIVAMAWLGRPAHTSTGSEANTNK